MAGSTEPPQQYNQASRKGKRAWRKNINVSEIQDGLEQARDEAIQGGIVSEKPSSSLFITDTAGSSTIRTTYRKTHKPLTADKILAQRSAIPAVDTRKRSSSDVNSKTTDGVLGPRPKRPKSTYVPPKELERLYKRAYGGDTVTKDLDISVAPSTDPWADSRPSQDPKTSFLDPPKSVRAPGTLSLPPTSLLTSSHLPPSIPKPKPAHSYNPAFQDWDAALQSEGAKAVAAERARLVSEAVGAREQARIAAAALEPEIDPLLLPEKSEAESESAWEGFSSAWDTETEVATKRMPGRKTRAERNRIRRRKEEEALARHRAEMKRRDEQAARVKLIAAEVREAEEEKARKKNVIAGNKEKEVVVKMEEDRESPEPSDAEDEDADDPRLLRREHRQGPRALAPKNLELLLPDELVDSLRRLKPEGNLLKDRFRSLQVRGKIEVRRPVGQVKKARRTTTEKWSYKDWSLVV